MLLLLLLEKKPLKGTVRVTSTQRVMQRLASVLLLCNSKLSGSSREVDQDSRPTTTPYDKCLVAISPDRAEIRTLFLVEQLTGSAHWPDCRTTIERGANFALMSIIIIISRRCCSCSCSCCCRCCCCCRPTTTTTARLCCRHRCCCKRLFISS